MPLYPNLIGIHGLKRAGKGTISSYLARYHGYTNLKFSGPLKAMLSVMLRRHLDLTKDDIERCIESDLKEVSIPTLGGKTPRYLMQTLGTDFRDAVCTDMWTFITDTRIRQLIKDGGRATLDDLRFSHEVVCLRRRKSVFWRVWSDTTQGQDVFSKVPWQEEAPVSLDIDEDILYEMMTVLLVECGFALDEAEDVVYGRTPDVSIPQFGGKTVQAALGKLRSVWLPSLSVQRLPFSPAAATIHVSERGLPAEIFDITFENNGSVDDLEALLEDALTVERDSFDTARAEAPWPTALAVASNVYIGGS